MDAYDPISNKSYSYRSVDSPDIDYDVPHQQYSEFFDNFLVLDEWMNEDQASIVPEYQDHTLAYASPVFDNGSPSMGSSSSPVQGNSNGVSFVHVWPLNVQYLIVIHKHGQKASGIIMIKFFGFMTVGGTGMRQAQKATKEKVAFRTKSQVEVLDDGFKWRKYGKKMVKNSPNPRNYYRCSAEGCSVKKRIERDVEDARYVITTYEGIHNHQRPSNF